MRSSVTVPLKEFGTYFKEALDHPLPHLTVREEKLRVSGFPYCGLKHAYHKMERIVETEGNANMTYYTSVGTAAHEAFQRWLGSKGRIYGNWRCRNLKCKKFVKFSPSNKCPRCKSEMEYVEFEVTAFKHVSGHLDGVFQDRKGRFWVIDYKTSSIKAIYRHRKFKDVFPYGKNLAQISAYVPMIEELFGIKVEGWMLIYVSRDNPRIYEVVGDVLSDKRKARIMKRIRGYDRQYGVVQRIASFDDIQYLIENKFCRDRDHYIDEMKGFKGCPLEGVCFDNQKQLRRILKMSLAEHLETVKKE